MLKQGVWLIPLW